MTNKEKTILKDIISEILANANEELSMERDDFTNGKILAYNEVLSIIKNYLTGYDLKEFELDFDIDKKYV
ncbi:MAG: hypothetical protein JG777_3008 [Clostridia bacterium]|jgi:hypothetical protein|nr:hypothetical protein [Clostridia bacterium]